jgi:nitroreductase / dihydropteridine reductase
MKLSEALQWRYATKRMNGERVPAEKLEAILEAIQLSPSSMGLQPYNVILIDDEATKASLKAAAYNQPQITEASHLLVFAAWEDITAENVDFYLQEIIQTRNVSAESLEAFKAALMGIVTGRTKEQKYEWAARQSYIAFSNAITAAAFEKVDATPMEGFVPAEVDRILGLEKKGLRSVTILALGFRDEKNDYMVSQKKVRRAKEVLFVKKEQLN